MWNDLIKNIQPISENINRDQNDLATIIYTSGTTEEMQRQVMQRFF